MWYDGRDHPRHSHREDVQDGQRADLGFFRDLVDKVSWNEVLKGEEVWEGWAFLKNES